MRKVWRIILTAVVLMAMTAVPVTAAIQSENLFWGGNAPAIKQPTVLSIYQPVKPAGTKANRADTSTPAPKLTVAEHEILLKVNRERAKAGLAPLQLNYRLVQTARAKSKDMIDHGYFDHQSPDLGSPFDQMKRAGIAYHYAGENIAGNNSAAGAMDSWMNSAGHRANILNPDFTHIGIGVVDGGPYGKMLTQQFIGV